VSFFRARVAPEPAMFHAPFFTTNARKQVTRIVLDAPLECDCIAPMKLNFKFFVVLASLALVAVGCVDTVTERKAAGVPFIKDRIEGRYERPVDDVFEAAKKVVSENGVLLNEGIQHGGSNLVKTVEGKVNQRNVWVRVEQIDPKVTAVTVQTRTPGGNSDIDLAANLEKQVALKLVR
jgi:hypothetical protein